MNLFKPKSLAFTGHRKYNNQAWVDAALNAVIPIAMKLGYNTFISGMAEGIDQVAIKTVMGQHNAQTYIIAARPFLKHGLGNPNYASLLMGCNEVHVIGGADYEKYVYVKRDRWMIDRSDAVIAVLDSRISGGTRYTFEYARSEGKPVFRINPDDKTMGWIGNRPT